MNHKRNNRVSGSFLLLSILAIVGCAREASPTATTNSAPNASQSATKEDPAAEADKMRHEDLDAILWIQTSGEYGALTRQAYQAAKLQLASAIGDATWTASTEQEKLSSVGEIDMSELPMAVVLDVDETVLDNSAYQVGLIESKSEYSRDGWKLFCESKKSAAIPGAVEFVNHCRAADVKVLFVTNREHEVESSTRENLINVGLMKDDDPDIVFSKYEKDNWKSDKITRRTELAKQYRILMLIGDDLHDFASTGHHPTSDARKKFATENADMWGSKWIVMPNPNYGGWEQSTYDWNNSSSAKTKLEKKRSNLRR